MAGSKSVSRRRVEIRYDVQTKGAVANIRRFARENGLQLRKIKKEQQKTTKSTEALRRSVEELKGVFAAVFVFDKFKEALSKVSEVTVRLRGENDSLVKSAKELKGNLEQVAAAVGSVFLEAVDVSDTFQGLNDKLEALTASIANADTVAGQFVRQGLSAMVGVGQLAINIFARLALAVALMARGMDVAKSAFEVAFHGIRAIANSEEIHSVSSTLQEQRDTLAGFSSSESLLQGARSAEAGGLNEEGHRLRRLLYERGIAEAAVASSEQHLSSLTGNFEQSQEAVSLSLDVLTGDVQRFVDTALAGDDAISQVNKMLNGIQTALEDLPTISLDFIDPEANGGEALAAARQAGQDLGDALSQGLRERIEAGVSGARGSGASVGRSVASGMEDLIEGITAGNILRKNKAEGSGSVLDVESILGTSTVNQFTNNVGTMSSALGEFFASGMTGAEDFGEALKNTLGSSMSSIGSGLLSGAAQVALGAAAGPMGWMLALGGAFSLVGGLLSGTGGGGRSSGINASSASPLSLGSIRPDVASGGTAGNTYVIQTGASFFGQDDARRAVGDYARQAVQYGELNLNG